VTSEVDVRGLVAATIQRFGRIDVLVNNAGIQKPQLITETSVEDWDVRVARRAPRRKPDL
jgi:NAD(P)-dependent dehydrogenase (short-subunit alcohol dehydrogenase family)